MDYPTPERSPSGLQYTVATQDPNNNSNNDTGKGQRFVIETVCNGTAADGSSETPQLHPQASLSPEEQFASWGEDLLLELDTTLNQDRAHQSNVDQHSSSVDPVTPTRLRRYQNIIPVADTGASHRPSRIHRLSSEQISPVKELKGHDFMERGQRHVQDSGPASVGASSSRAPKAHLEDLLPV